MPRKPDNSLSASHTLCIGGTGSGKTTWILKNRLPKTERSVIVWDGKDEHGHGNGVERITSPAALAARLAKSNTGRIAFVSTPDTFGFFCRAVWAWGHCLCLVEELADVTTPAKAPRSWGELIRKGRAHGIRTISTTQRPQEIDKTIIGNAADVMIGFMPLEPDRKYIANRIGFPMDELNAMDVGDWLYRVLPRGEIERGNLRTKARRKAK